VAGNLSALLAAFTRQPVLWAALEPRARAPGAATLEKLAAESEPAAERRLDEHAARAAALVIAVDGDGEPGRAALARWLERCERRVPCVVLELGALERAGVEHCDAVVHVDRAPVPPAADRDPSLRVLSVVNRAAPGAVALPIAHCEPFVLPVEPRLASLDPRARASFALDCPRAPISIALQRLARKLLGRTVGLAIGGGAAFGIAHVGVLRVLESAGVPIDLVAGTSTGSLIALGYSVGLDAAELERIALGLGTPSTLVRLLDPTLFRPGLLAGDRLVGLFLPHAGESRDFVDLVRPCRVVATDIESGERVVIGSGAIDQAFRASCSVPGLWAPVRFHGRVLVDGAVSDPVPVDVVHEMGAEICLAIHVVGRPRKGARSLVTRISGALNRVNPLAYLADDRSLPSTFDVLWNSLQTLQHELGRFGSVAADLRIEPDLAEFTWTDLHRAGELIRRGAEAARAALPEVRRVLAGRGFELGGSD
jgi:NTE family protein